MPKSEQGVSADRYMIIPRTLVFLTKEDAVLLIKGAPTKRLWANRYNGIGGHIHAGESVLAATRRELMEETGLSSPDLRLVGTVMIDADAERGVGLYVFRGSYAGGELVESVEGALEWVPLDRLPTLPLVKDLYTLLPYVLKMQPGDPPFSALYFYDENDQMQVEISA